MHWIVLASVIVALVAGAGIVMAIPLFIWFHVIRRRRKF